jgi:hypothetical protein
MERQFDRSRVREATEELQYDRLDHLSITLARFADIAAVLFADREARRDPGTLPMRESPATINSQARSAASSKSGASAGRTCQPVTFFPNA